MSDIAFFCFALQKSRPSKSDIANLTRAQAITRVLELLPLSKSWPSSRAQLSIFRYGTSLSTSAKESNLINSTGSAACIVTRSMIADT
ncbi:hypothetical protein N7539_006197 [Penicillium diatomitis]|uniref:Uncharacterized protein n=1 Tax=Penicillium diatomitis TaxID=2819901 RepID=A0A9W9X2X0_9EURO|nr:uncharacterized protein N7539_006197 [Penicillium diatomitis]KAJ5482751.1 hypothetical protein N7539_006197 [Penicillium diatomitis]